MKLRGSAAHMNCGSFVYLSLYRTVRVWSCGRYGKRRSKECEMNEWTIEMWEVIQKYVMI